jgi:RNA polymerase sigma-70 factor (ECF subfamily)
VRPSPPAEITDLELLRRVADGDEAAFGVLAERLAPILRRVLYRVGLAEAEVEDVGQETLVRIWRGSATFKDRSSVTTWACQIALNQAYSLLRKERRRPEPEPKPAPDVESDFERRQRAQEVRSAVLALPFKLRVVIVLREFEDLSYRSIAQILEVPVGTVMSRLHEGRTRLRRRLATE